MTDWDGQERRSGRERRKKRVYRFIDRRDGFDRRKRYPILDPLRRGEWPLVALLVALNFFSLMDGIFTYIGLSGYGVREGNPVLFSLIASNPLWAVLFKIIVILLVSFGIWHQRHLRMVLELLFMGLGIYIILLFYHIGLLSFLALR